MNRSVPTTLLLLAFLVGCSGEDAAPPSVVATTTVDLPKSYRFEPAAIQVDLGATVTWTNHDEFTHNVAFEGDAPLAMKPGESVTRTFPTAGTFGYMCSLHPREMRGSVTVTDPG
jgi:plastocyanin